MNPLIVRVVLELLIECEPWELVGILFAKLQSEKDPDKLKTLREQYDYLSWICNL